MSPIADNPISVLTVDDHPVYREGLAALIRSQPDFVLVAQACNGAEALDLYPRHRPAVVIMDIQMPDMDGITATSLIRARDPAARIIVLTTFKGDSQAVRALKAGAAGYLLKITAPQELIASIRQVHRGKRQVLAEVVQEIAEYGGDERLTGCELEVLRRVADGNSNRFIARELGIGEDTVEFNVASILAKLEAENRTHAVAIAVQRNIIFEP